MIANAPTLTDLGKSLLMRAIAGEQVTFTRFKAGSGTLPSGQAIADLTDLIHTEIAFAVTNVNDREAGYIAITGEFSSEDVTADFAWRELGIFARGEDDIEVLYAYSNDGANAGIVRALDTDVTTLQTVTMIVAVDEAENITVEYTPQEVPQTVLRVDCGTVSSASKTVSDPGITGDMEVVRAVLSNPAAQRGEWTVTTVTGALTITGAIAENAETGVVLYLARAID